MGDHNTETLQLRNRRDEHLADELLQRTSLHLNAASIPLILNHIDYFVSQSRGNESIGAVHLWLYDINGHNNEVWHKVGQAIGNLQALKRLHICNSHDADEEVPIPNWERLARILSHVRQKIEVKLVNSYDEDDDTIFLAWRAEESRSLARAIRGHPTIRSFDCHNNFPHEATDTMYSVLATLSALEVVAFSSPPEDGITLANPESLTELLRASSLRSVIFEDFFFTPALCQATANALMEGTAITRLNFQDCSFIAGECAAMMASGIGRNTSVISITSQERMGEAHVEVLAAALPLNSTLQELTLGVFSKYRTPTHVDWSPILLAMGKNTGLKNLKVDSFDWMDEPLCTAMQNGLGMNETLESLELNDILLTDDNSDLWRRALSFLRTNKVLKSLVVTLDHDVTDSRAAAFLTDIVTMLQENSKRTRRGKPL
jgi:hypothetical protein